MTGELEIYNWIASYLSEEKLIEPEEKIRFIELLHKGDRSWRSL